MTNPPTKPPSTPWLVRAPAPTGAVRLFCFPHAGGGAALFHPWPRVAPPWLDVCAVELPGRGRRLDEPPLRTIPALAAAAGEALVRALEPPFALFGHSMGALLAFELARWLRARGLPPPCHLFVAGHRAPQLPPRGRAIGRLPEPEFVEELRALGGTPPEVLDHPELFALVSPALRADIVACEDYRYADGPPLQAPLSAFGGAGDADVEPAELEAWRAQAGSTFSSQTFPGGHFFLDPFEPVLRAIAAALSPSAARRSE